MRDPYRSGTAFFGVSLLLFYAFLLVTRGIPEFNRGLPFGSDTAWINFGEWATNTPHFIVAFVGLIAGGVHGWIRAHNSRSHWIVPAFACVGAFGGMIIGTSLCELLDLDYSTSSGHGWYVFLGAGFGFAGTEGFRRACNVALRHTDQL